MIISNHLITGKTKFIAHIGLIFAVYYTFKQFHKAEKSSVSVFKSKNYDPSKIMVIVFVILFMFVFSKGVEVLVLDY